MIRSYSDLIRLNTIVERFEYLKLGGAVGQETFGAERWVNQNFYRSREWRDMRDYIIVRDEGCDLGLKGFYIHADLRIHHMNPMRASDIRDEDPNILNPEYLITTSLMTHNAIHYGDESLLPQFFTERRPGDTKLW